MILRIQKYNTLLMAWEEKEAEEEEERDIE